MRLLNEKMIKEKLMNKPTIQLYGLVKKATEQLMNQVSNLNVIKT